MNRTANGILVRVALTRLGTFVAQVSPLLDTSACTSAPEGGATWSAAAPETAPSASSESTRAAQASGKASAMVAPAEAGLPPTSSAQVTATLAASAATSAETSPEPSHDKPPCPPEMALVGRTCVDRYEAHLVLRNEDGSTTLHPHYLRPPAEKPFEAQSSAEVFPQAYVSRIESQAACFAASKRLCTFDEWRRACKGSHRWPYPYGIHEKRGACNSSKPHLLPQLFGGDTRTWKYDENFNSPLLNQKEGYLAKGGAHPDCQSDEGTFDMVGNLHEWVSGIVTDSFVEKLDTDGVDRRKQPWHVGNGIFVGGFYSTSAEHGPGCLNVTIAHEPRYHDYSTGFRCCKAADLPPLDTKKTKPKKAPKPSAPAPLSAPVATAEPQAAAPKEKPKPPPKKPKSKKRSRSPTPTP